MGVQGGRRRSVQEAWANEGARTLRQGYEVPRGVPNEMLFLLHFDGLGQTAKPLHLQDNASCGI